jgi:DNA polymerase
MLSNEDKIDLFDDLDTEINKCSICPLSDDCNPILGYGSLKSSILMVRDYPEFGESRTGNLWSSPTARLFNKILHAAHINYNKIYTTYLVHCRPLNNKIISDDIKKCSNYLERIIHIVEPKIIVTCGRLSLHYFLGNTKNICNNRGTFFEKIYNGRNILIYPLNHPTSMIKLPTTKKKEMFDDLNLLFSKMIELGIVIE